MMKPVDIKAILVRYEDGTVLVLEDIPEKLGKIFVGLVDQENVNWTILSNKKATFFEKIKKNFSWKK